jgi:hypothetical protein
MQRQQNPHQQSAMHLDNNGCSSGGRLRKIKINFAVLNNRHVDMTNKVCNAVQDITRHHTELKVVIQ